MEIKRTMLASQLIIAAQEQYNKRPTQLKFEELVNVVQVVIKNCNIQPIIKSFPNNDEVEEAANKEAIRIFYKKQSVCPLCGSSNNLELAKNDRFCYDCRHSWKIYF